MGFTQAENDVADVMIWLRCNHGREVSYADIAAGVEFPDGHRLRRAVGDHDSDGDVGADRVMAAGSPPPLAGLRPGATVTHGQP
ncbi:hypothetical protein [Nonomuraea jiangxiensis]|uniref:Uncharacterized protein n=1 Tax=Nonomuraea jiangxiensis TaxID=633440 RepID=A0A1G9HY42_9ACTN|nr:hypothetical protein [Nonomuraea jiangxiensis]SDL17917.1 hypothetical protein SAMN05421869_12322 [Nonomuraea jiangxiensis]